MSAPVLNFLRRDEVLPIRNRLASLLTAAEAARSARADWEAQQHPFGAEQWDALDHVHKLEEQLIQQLVDPQQVRFLKAVLEQVDELLGEAA